MKNFLILILSFCVFSFANAQSKAVKKIKKYYEAGANQKALAECNKYIFANPNKHDPYVYFYKAQVYRKIHEQKNHYDLLVSLTLALEAKKYDKSGKLFAKDNKEGQELINAFHTEAEKLFHDKEVEQSKLYVIKLAEEFKDTLHLAESYFPDKFGKPKVDPNLIHKHNGGKIDEVVTYALKYVGKPYVYAAEGPNSFDCSGFMKYVHHHFEKELPHSANMISKLGTKVDKSQIKKGDLIFFGTTRAYHVAMFITDGTDEDPKIIHAVSRGVSVDHYNANTHWGKQKVFAVKRMW